MLAGKRVLLSIGLIFLIGTLAALAYLDYKDYERSRQLEWELELVRHYRDTDAITLNVGSIQFLRQGYSISIDEATYGPNGVTLAGTIGNPFFLELSSLTLLFEVRKPYLSLREEYLDNPFNILLDKDIIVGSSQVAVGVVAPGSTSSFRTIIPNVKQPADQYEVTISFSGERYRYLR